MESDKHEPGDQAEDDAVVIRRSLRAPEHFGALFNRYAPTIHRYLARRLGPASADDLVAETFLAAFRRRHSYDLARGDARPWLYGIATHVIGQHRRDEARKVRLLWAIPADRDEAGHADRVAAHVTAQAMRSTSTDALATLAPDERDVLLLIAWEDLSYDEVATALAIPIGTVRSRLSRARRRIREALNDVTPNKPVEEILKHG
jgi:RNA polymerase sigma-70 factor, ECF subfamily